MIYCGYFTAILNRSVYFTRVQLLTCSSIIHASFIIPLEIPKTCVHILASCSQNLFNQTVYFRQNGDDLNTSCLGVCGATDCWIGPTSQNAVLASKLTRPQHATCWSSFGRIAWSWNCRIFKIADSQSVYTRYRGYDWTIRYDKNSPLSVSVCYRLRTDYGNSSNRSDCYLLWD